VAKEVEGSLRLKDWPYIPMEGQARRGPVLTTFAALFALLALSNISKP
jgi:hypothetical protein